MSENYSTAFEVTSGDFVSAGEASRKVKRVLQKIGINNSLIRKVAIATYEAEMNLAIHSLGGTITMNIEKDKVIINIEDKGPGIPDVNLAMTEGYSTATNEIREMGFGAGMGLPNMKNCADEFEINSEFHVGTKIKMIFNNVW